MVNIQFQIQILNVINEKNYAKGLIDKKTTKYLSFKWMVL